MEHLINYYTHKTYQPPYYHRQYEQDLPENRENPGLAETAKRALHIAVPFLSLYKPLGNTISITMGGLRVLSHLNGGVQSASEENAALAVSYEVFQTALAVTALAGTLFNFTLGIYLTTGVDLTTNVIHIVQELISGEYEKAGEEFLQALGSSLYLAIMLSGSLEVILASLVVQAAVSFYQSRKEWVDGRVPEAIAKMLMGCIRLYQANEQIELIQRRNFLFSLKKYELLRGRIEKGKDVDHLLDHPLGYLAVKVDENKAILVDDQGNEFDFGSNFHGFGKGAVKGMNVRFKEKTVDGKEITELDFKVNHVFRDRLDSIIQEMQGLPSQDLKDFLRFLSTSAEDVSISKQMINFEEQGGQGLAYKIDLKGLGSVFIGASKDLPTLYDRVCIQMEKGKNIYDFHEALSFLNLDDALRVSASDDIERMKMGQLFRMFSPKQATLFERTDSFFDLPLEEFREEILKNSPEMEGVFEKYLSRMDLREILPGRMRYGINGFADELKDEGAKGLTAAVTGAFTKEEVYEQVASILKMGLISTEMRNSGGIHHDGYGPFSNYYSGGADSVFTQMITDEVGSFSDFWYISQVRILFNLEALETGTYQYHFDNLGNRRLDNYWGLGRYLDRPNIVDFVREENRWFQGDNEVMVKERIPPSLIDGLVVQDEQYKLGLLEHLRKSHIVQIGNDGSESIFGIPVDKFIHVGDSISDFFLA